MVVRSLVARATWRLRVVGVLRRALHRSQPHPFGARQFKLLLLPPPPFPPWLRLYQGTLALAL